MSTVSTDMACNGMSLYQLMEQSIVKLFEVNVPGWPPTAIGDCDHTYRAIHATCWEWDQESIEIKKYRPCDGKFCCEKDYKVCIGLDGQRIVTKLGTINDGNSTCNPQVPNVHCAPICEESEP